MRTLPKKARAQSQTSCVGPLCYRCRKELQGSASLGRLHVQGLSLMSRWVLWGSAKGWGSPKPLSFSTQGPSCETVDVARRVKARRAV
jgi:hypothetical protein